MKAQLSSLTVDGRLRGIEDNTHRRKTAKQPFAHPFVMDPRPVDLSQPREGIGDRERQPVEVGHVHMLAADTLGDRPEAFNQEFFSLSALGLKHPGEFIGAGLLPSRAPVTRPRTIRRSSGARSPLVEVLEDSFAPCGFPCVLR